jgi:multiple sugar transport system substrate-binding protein
MQIQRRPLLTCVAAAIGALAFALPASAQQQNVTFWYHVDNAENTKLMDELVKTFEAKNPAIKIKAENIPWNNYFDKLFISIAGGQAPDVAVTRLALQPQLLEMNALEPITKQLATWPAKADLAPNLLDINKAADGEYYYMPLQYVAIYLYYRADLFAKYNVKPPTTCEEFRDAAKKLTLPASANGGTELYGFGMRGGKGGHDNWGPFVLAQTELKPGALTSPKAVAANQWYIDLLRKDKVAPPSAPNDGFNEITSAFKSGRTAMIFHHVGSAKAMADALGDKVSAVPVPSCGGGRWTYFGDESTTMFKTSKVKDAAWKWMSFLSEGDNNLKFNEATGQLTVTKSGSAKVPQPARFVKATMDSLAFAKPLPLVPQTADFVSTVWPTTMQRALNGEITSAQMMGEIDKHFSSK